MEKWQRSLADALCDPDELARRFDLDREMLRRVAERFPFRIPRGYLALIRAKGDPIYRQCVPDPRELEDDPALLDDPLGEESHTLAPGVVRRYPDRCLLMASGSCAMHCRFCTRKRKFRQPFTVSPEELRRGIECIARHPEIRDVLISGGDPFLLEDDRLEALLAEVRRIEHVEIVRIGTRTPCTLPERITRRLAAMLKKFHPLYVNVHFNHPDELTPAACRALARLADAGIPLGSQSVLLKGVNDDAETLKRLMQKLLAARVRPYYIFLPDLIYGTSHFRTSIARATALIDRLRGWTSGMAVPHLIIDLPRGYGKVALTPEHLVSRNGADCVFANYRGELCHYPDVEE